MKFKIQNKAQILPITMIIMAVTLALIFSNIERISLLTKKIKYQRRADAIALSTGTETARSFNALAGLNNGIDELAKQFSIYASVAFGATLISFIVGFGFTAKVAAEIILGGRELAEDLGEIGQEMDVQINQIQSELFENMCDEIKKQNIDLLLSFLTQNTDKFRNISTESLSQNEYRFFSDTIKATQHQFVEIYPNICNTRTRKNIFPLHRSNANENFQTCENLHLDNEQDLNMLKTNAHSKALKVDSGVGYYHFEPEEETVGKPRTTVRRIEFTQNSREVLPYKVDLDYEANFPENHTKTYPFAFNSGEVKVCHDIQETFKNISRGTTAFKLPKKTRENQNYTQNTQFLIKVSYPYQSLKPFLKSDELFQAQKGLGLSRIDSNFHNFDVYYDRVQKAAQAINHYIKPLKTIDTYAQFRITGGANFEEMTFVPTLMPTSLANEYEQRNQHASR